MSQEQSKVQPVEQAGSPGKAAGVGLEVGGVHNKDEESWFDLWALSPETRAYLKSYRRDAACPHAPQRGKGAGDGSKEITTPEKLRKLQRALYRKAKAKPGYRFWSLYSELTRLDLLEHALQLVELNGGAPGVDGQTIASITTHPKIRKQWLEQLQRELQTKTYRPRPVRRVYILKPEGGQRPLGIPTVKDRTVQMAAMLVLAPIFEADFHPHSYGFRPRRNAHQALDAIIAALRQGKLEVVDADLSKYFDTIPHRRLMKLLARRLSDGSVLHLLRQWLDAPIIERAREGTRRVLPNRQGVPQGGVISPLLANLYLNALDWAVNDPKQAGQPVMVRYADDFVILCAPGQATQVLARLRRWLEARGLKLNEEKTRKVHSQEGFRFLGFSVHWRRSRRSGRGYAHIEPSAKSQQRLRDKVRGQLNHWTLHRRIPEAVEELNTLLRGWSGYFHYRQSSRVFGDLNHWLWDRLRRWLWRKHKCTKALWSAYPNELLHNRYGLWRLPLRVSWKLTKTEATNAL
jgi:group II intron reverse transcriptase/maturase